MSAVIERDVQPRQELDSQSWRATARRWRIGDRLFSLLCLSMALSVVLLFAGIVGVLLWQAGPAFREIGLGFLTSSEWDPEPTHRRFGALTFIYGSLVTSAIAMGIAVPLGIGTAAFLSEIAPGWLRTSGAFFVELLAAIPSVVYGFWGVLVLAPLVQRLLTAVGGANQGGTGIFTAGVILSIMIVPYIAAVALDMCRAVPIAQREGSYALGATRWQTIWSVVLPYARPGIVGGCFLALGRALGETMAVTMLIGNRREFSFNPFAPGYSIPSVIANELLEADYPLYEAALVELAVVLLLVSVGVNMLARYLIWKTGRIGPRSVSLWRRLIPQEQFASPPAAGLTITATVLAPGATEPVPAVSVAVVAPPREADSAGDFSKQSTAARRRLIDRAMSGVLASCLGLTVGVLLWILGYIGAKGFGSLDWNFFTKLPQPVGELGGGLAHAIIGSLVLVGLAAIGAVPLGVLAGVYLTEHRANRLSSSVRLVGELLAGIPSIVIGIFAYYVLVKPLGHFSGWAGAFALGAMMIPIVMRTTEEALKTVPAALRHGSFALGATHAQTIWRVVLPAALPAIVTGVFLSIARVIGETAPLLLTAGSSSRYWPRSPGDWVPALPEYIFRYATSASEDWRRMGWAAALVLLVAVMILSVGVRLVLGRRAISTRQAG